ncbi:MAG TPA: hypothetical protein VFQ36_00940 [Ktedonobacteraceae bacterium]|nr:hypothetical protein [Ktedonobacteraceae bacterium]
MESGLVRDCGGVEEGDRKGKDKGDRKGKDKGDRKGRLYYERLWFPIVVIVEATLAVAFLTNSADGVDGRIP